MNKCTNPFEAMLVANSIMVRRNLDVMEGEWAKEILSYTCNRKYGAGEITYEVEIHVTQKGFNEVKETLGTVDYAISTYRVTNDPYVRVTISLEGILKFLVLVHEEACDAIVAL